MNVLEYWEHAPDGTLTHFAWVTDIPINDRDLMILTRGARPRGKIENETFNTIENQDDHLNHGRSRPPPPEHSAHALMMQAFLIDPIQQRGCRLFQAACGGSSAAASTFA